MSEQVCSLQECFKPPVISKELPVKNVEALGQQRNSGAVLFSFSFFLLVSVLPLVCTPDTHKECGTSAYRGESLEQGQRVLKNMSRKTGHHLKLVSLNLLG